MKLILSIIFTLFVCSAVGEVVKHSECSNVVSQCTVHTLRINPCPQAATNSETPCQIKRGRQATIDFEYTADFNATSGKGEIFWMSPESDLPFIGMDPKACDYTQCPITHGQRNTYVQVFETMRKYPAKLFELKFKLSNSDNPAEFCCFVFKIKLTK